MTSSVRNSDSEIRNGRVRLKRLLMVMLFLLLAIGLVACSVVSNPPTATPIPPTATVVRPTATPVSARYWSLNEWASWREARASCNQALLSSRSQFVEDNLSNIVSIEEMLDFLTKNESISQRDWDRFKSFLTTGSDVNSSAEWEAVNNSLHAIMAYMLIHHTFDNRTDFVVEKLANNLYCHTANLQDGG